MYTCVISMFLSINLSRLQQEPKKEVTPAAVSAAPGGIDLVKIISSIASSSSSSTQNFIDQPADYWKRVLSIAGVDPATGTPATTSTASAASTKTQQTMPSSPTLGFNVPQSSPAVATSAPAKTDPRRRDPRQQPAASQMTGMASSRDVSVPPLGPLPIFPKLEVTAVIESRDGDAPYILRQIEPAPSPARYEKLVHLVEMNFRLKTDPRLVRHLEKLPRKEEVLDTPQSPPQQQQQQQPQMLQPGGNYMPPLVPPLVPPMVSMAGALGTMGNLAPGMGNMVQNMAAVLGSQPPGGKTPLLPLPSLPPINLSPMQQLIQDPRSKIDPRLSRDPRNQTVQNSGSVGVEPSRMGPPLGVDSRGTIDPNGFQQRMPGPIGPMNPMAGAMATMNDPRRPGAAFLGPRQQVDPRQAARAVVEAGRQFGPPPRQGPPGGLTGAPLPGAATGAPIEQAPMSSDSRQKTDPRSNRNDPRQKRDPRNKEQMTPVAKEGHQSPPLSQSSVEDTNTSRPKMTYSSPLSAYHDGAQENSYTRRNIGRSKKKSQAGKNAAGQAPANPPSSGVSAAPAIDGAGETEKPVVPSVAEPSASPVAPADMGAAALPPPPSLLSHPVDPYAPADDKPLSEMFKTKDPTASPFN